MSNFLILSSLVLCFLAAFFLESHAKSVTYDEIGTFTDHDFYDKKWRPRVEIPKSPEETKTEFQLYTRKNKDKFDLLTWNKLDQYDHTHFDPTLPTKVIVHGFIDSSTLTHWMHDMKDRFLQIGNYNVILVDWHHANQFPYVLAVANTRVVGAMLGILIRNLCRHYHIKPESFHILGHSLGSHVAGYAGKRLNGTLGHITGFDPAGPYYEGLTNPEARLWHTDAQFVESIHTDARHLFPDFGFGMYETCSHVDFFPNGGRTQPGCDQERFTTIFTDGLIDGVCKLIQCNHGRSIEFYYESLLPTEATPIAYACEDFQSFEDGKCHSCGEDGSNCAILGPQAVGYKKFLSSPSKPSGKRFFMATAPHKNFMRFQYMIRIKMSPPSWKHVPQHGKISFKLDDKQRKGQVFVFNENDQTFEYGTTYTKVIVSDFDPDKLDDIEFSWSHNLNIIHSRIFIDQVEIIPLSAKNGMNGIGKDLKFKAQDDQGILNGHFSIFKRIFS